MEEIQNPFETVVRQNNQILDKLERQHNPGGKEEAYPSLTDSRAVSRLATGLATGVVLLSLLGGLALTLRSLRNMDLKLLLELKRE